MRSCRGVHCARPPALRAAALAGERNERLYKTAFRLAAVTARGWLLWNIRHSIAGLRGWAPVPARARSPREQMKIESGLQAGLNAPDRDDLEDHDDGTARTGDGNGAGRRRQEKQKETPQRSRVTGNGTTRIFIWTTVAWIPGNRCISAQHASLADRCRARRRRHRRSHRTAADWYSLWPDRRGAPCRQPVRGSGHTCWTCLVGLSGSGETHRST